MACFLTPTRRSKMIAEPPFRIALIHLVLFSVAVVAYSTLWHEASVKTNDSPGYLAVAQDLSACSGLRMRATAPRWKA